MLLPDLSGLRVAPRDRRRAPRATGGAFATSFVAKIHKRASWGVEALETEISKALGTMFLEKLGGVYNNGFNLSGDGESVIFLYTNTARVMRKLVFSEWFLVECVRYFEKPSLINHLENASDARVADVWNEERGDAIRLFYNFSSMDGSDPGLRCLCATDLCYLTPIEGAPPRQYVQEFLCQPWYFRQFMVAFDELLPMFRSGEIFSKSFAELATLSWKALGWNNDPHKIEVNLGSFTVTESYPLTEEDLRLLSARFAYTKQVLTLVDSPDDYHKKFDAFVKDASVLPPATPFSTPTRKGQTWAIFLKRTLAEHYMLLFALETMWKTYGRTRSLTALVDLIQQFNGNHYFRDGNGRFSMLLIQLHMKAFTGQLVYFWDHNPNGPCLAKYVRMLDTTPRIPAVALPGAFDREPAKEAYEAAYQTRCDGAVHEPMPYLESAETGADTPQNLHEKRERPAEDVASIVNSEPKRRSKGQ
ncbi:MAG: hypothetical protein CMI29_08485 [Opitutae bacterium]|nr:hypothetical protein [Opitutae bacterium]|tara:strand:- start:8106 stop:9530 length:1425 start_codon:yes stop_codon:yes gene_type:complete